MHLIRMIGREERGERKEKPPPKLISRPFGVLDLPEGGRSRSSAKFDKRITKVAARVGLIQMHNFSMRQSAGRYC